MNIDRMKVLAGINESESLNETEKTIIVKDPAKQGLEHISFGLYKDKQGKHWHKDGDKFTEISRKELKNHSENLKKQIDDDETEAIDITDFWVDVVEAGNITVSLWGNVEFGNGFLKVEDEEGDKYTIKDSQYKKLADKYGNGKPFMPAEDTKDPLRREVKFVPWKHNSTWSIT